MYHIAVIGGGVAGLVTASGAAQFGARVALIDKSDRLGGDCLNYGCVPTKTLIGSSRLFHQFKTAGDHGIYADNLRLDFARTMRHMREVQAKIAEHDDPDRFRKMGVDVIFGEGRFKDNNTFEVNGREIRAKNFLIATGSRPALPPIPGLKEANPLTNESILELDALPSSLAIIGAGPIGCEYAQMFARFGSRVTLMQRSGRILAKEDGELSSRLWERLEREGVEILTVEEYKEARREGDKTLLTVSLKDGGERVVETDCLLVAAGRTPNTEGLGLEAAGVVCNGKGVQVDNSLRTTAKNIWAAGDVNGIHQFTHSAENQAGIVISNALFPLVRRKLDTRATPWCTFTEPELARVGLTEDEAVQQHGKDRVKVYRYEYADHDRAIIDGHTEGLVKLVCDGGGMILGAHILGAGAADLLHEYVLAMNSDLPLPKIAQTVHIYPSMGQVVKRGADQYYREKLFTGLFARFTSFLFGKKG